MTALMPPGVHTKGTPASTVAAAARRLDTTARVGLWGVKGGVGTTTIALLAGVALARHRSEAVIVADATLYGSLVIRAGMALPAEPFIRPATAGRPGIGVGCVPPRAVPMALLDAPDPSHDVDIDVMVLSATVDAVLLAQDHDARLVVLTQPTPHTVIDLDAASRRLGRHGAPVVAVPFDPHLAVGGPIDWQRLAPPTRDAIRRFAATLITVLSDLPSDLPSNLSPQE
jgi:hypothetical protein